LLLPRYLPGIKLPENIVACPDLIETCRDATMLVFVVPHQVKTMSTYNLFSHDLSVLLLITPSPLFLAPSLSQAFASNSRDESLPTAKPSPSSRVSMSMRTDSD